MQGLKALDTTNIFNFLKLLIRWVPVNKELLTGTVPVNKDLLTGRVPVNKLFLFFNAGSFSTPKMGLQAKNQSLIS